MTPILLVEDDHDIRLAMEMYLTSKGFAVTSCENGREALTALAGGLVPRVIVLDLMLPVMNGFETLRALRGDPRWSDIPVVVASGNRGYDADDLAVHAVIRKPFDGEDLVRAVAKAA